MTTSCCNPGQIYKHETEVPSGARWSSASRQQASALRAPKNWKKVIAGGFSAFCPEGACAISHGRKPVDRVGHDLQPQRGDSKTRINACYPLCSRPVGAKIHICIPSTGLRPWLAAQAPSGQFKYFSVCKTALFLGNQKPLSYECCASTLISHHPFGRNSSAKNTACAASATTCTVMPASSPSRNASANGAMTSWAPCTSVVGQAGSVAGVNSASAR